MQETQETQVQSLGWKDPLEKEIAAHPSISCLENPTDGGVCRATVYGGSKELDTTEHAHSQTVKFQAPQKLEFAPTAMSHL